MFENGNDMPKTVLGGKPNINALNHYKYIKVRKFLTIKMPRH